MIESTGTLSLFRVLLPTIRKADDEHGRESSLPQSKVSVAPFVC